MQQRLLIHYQYSFVESIRFMNMEMQKKETDVHVLVRKIAKVNQYAKRIKYE